MKRFEKYPSCFGKLSLAALCMVARRHGMYVIAGYKPNMHVYNEIGLYGTPEQMRAVEEVWTKAGNKLKPRSFRAVFGVRVKHIPPSKWLDIPTAHREWCEDHSHRNKRGCDFDSKLSKKANAALKVIHARLLGREKAQELK